MNFGSDNIAGVAPEIMAAIARANDGVAASYGGDQISQRLDELFSRVFETNARVFPVATGTAANSLALAMLCPPYGSIHCHTMSHIATDEAGAPEFYSGGGKLVLVDGASAKISASGLRTALDAEVERFPHSVRRSALSVSQATEAGAVYTPDELLALSRVAQSHGLRLHMDGARIANAIAHLDCAPADITWRAGIEVLSFGATKNGALAAEAVVFFGDADFEQFAWRRKRAGHLFSKMRFAAAQLEAMLVDDLWLRLARHANAMAERLALGLAAISGVRLAYPREANEVFIEVAEDLARQIEGAGAGAHRWNRGVPVIMRLVCAFDTPEDDVDALIGLVGRFSAGK
ncbi:MAG: beta-eliminating lyase-related protein [Proteobacteria bacterium]|nr:beta-eliminating lyase-related protein [Pseudomonadota bacterium]